MSAPLRRIALTALCTTAALGLTACSSSVGATADPAAAPSSAATPAVSATSAESAGDSAASPSAAAGATRAALATGNKLNSMLLPASALPKGFSVNSAGTVNTGDGYNPPSSPSAVPVAKACDAIRGTSWIDASGLAGRSFAQNDYSDSAEDLFGQEVDGFQGNDAKTVMTALRKVFAECANAKVTVNGTAYSARTTLRTVSGLGDDAVEAVTTSADLDGGTTLIAVRVGDLVVTTIYNDQKGTGAADLALTRRLVANVTAG
ncbi:hypothetical protein [Streptacidiphilus carbonis]|uniref:hypothetical protein n=1 Tax=Streptacidiphilus carbonis TaxID=105422 RepID=UPI00069351AB|nr:hypothetical protein [Streptacidiphilus carbonis]